MSELTVGTISGLAANNYVVDVAAGSLLTQPGMVLQVLSTTKTNIFTTTSTSFVDVTGLSVDITPFFASSKILVEYHVVSSMSSANWGGFGRLMRDATPISISTDTQGVRREASTGFYIAGNNQMALPTSGSHLDSPNTTNTVTYGFQIATQSSSYTAYVNSGGSGIFNGDVPSMVSSITVMEIAQ